MQRLVVLLAVLSSFGCSRSLAPGDSFQDCAECPTMVVVPAGHFLMGSPSTEAGRFEEEGPQHEVRIAEPFAVSLAPITRAEYDRFVSFAQRAPSRGCAAMSDEGKWVVTPELSWNRPGFEQSGDHPAVCVSWEDANAYARWLSQRSGRSYRLLSEAEFEYVARAGAATPFPW
ncbi:MAG TPA: SUMF1/EgtB/PvdO family nonheme iron enzyme, partial [Candidatus Polarisedimenticolaceae bacterium]|nr:SUMF1/EgtB/PvdO family nonheme iron enzyme [Candidatus Polarisedimenticolaceae bacterium]